MTEPWKDHVILEIVEATWDESRLLTITQLLTEMDKQNLIPEPVSDDLFNTIDFINERR